MTMIIRKEMAEHVSSTMYVFRGEKYFGVVRPTAKETVYKNTT